MLIVLSLGMFWFPSRAHADTTTGVGSLTPGTSGPLVATSPFTHDLENDTGKMTGDAGAFGDNYVRLTEYAWALDPLGETDPSHDYFIVFVSAAIQARGNGWCLAPSNQGELASLPSQLVTIKVDNGNILTNSVAPVDYSVGNEVASKGFNLGLDHGISAGISWSQTIYAWTIKVSSLNSTSVSWTATVNHGVIAGLDCNTDAWVWGYTAAISVDEGQTPVIEVSMTGVFAKYLGPNPVCIIISPVTCLVLGNFRVLKPSLLTKPSVSLSLPPAVSFETNPLVGSIAFRSAGSAASGEEFGHGDHSFFSRGAYSATAIPPDNYIFDHWEMDAGVISPVFHPTDNPTVVNVSGNGLLKAVFAAKLSFLTDPLDMGSISIAPTVGGECGSGHPSGDWTYISSLPPDGDGSVVVCANLPLGWPGEWSIEHWSSTAALAYSSNPNSNYRVIHTCQAQARSRFGSPEPATSTSKLYYGSPGPDSAALSRQGTRPLVRFKCMAKTSLTARYTSPLGIAVFALLRFQVRGMPSTIGSRQDSVLLQAYLAVRET